MQHITPFSRQGSFRKTNTPRRNPTRDISRRNLLQPESHPVLLAKQMMRFAMAIQHIYPGRVIRGLGKHHHAIMRQLAESAIKWVTTNDVFLGTLGGIEGIVLEALYHIDGGNIRQAWITIRRAVTAGQLLSLHQPDHYRFKVIDEDDDIDPEMIWSSAVTMERVLSLLLALPTSTGPCGTTASDVLKMPIEARDLTSVLSAITARVLDRNQIQVPKKALEMTLEIDRQLVIMTDNFPSDFWQPFTFTLAEENSINNDVDVQRLWDQMLYYSLVIQLHLPYMMSPKIMSSKTPSQRVYSRITCANASWEVLTREIAVRTLQLTTACSRLGDFLALIAGMTLVLAHAVSHSGDLADNPLAHQRRSDRATVERALLCMKSMSELHEDVFAAKCAALLKDLLAIEADAAWHTLREPAQSSEDRHSAFVTVVPYIGAIRIGQHGPTSLSPLKAEQERGSNDGVTIGGIGSMHIETSRLSCHGAGHVRLDCVAPEEPVMRELDGPLAQGNVAYSTQVPAAACTMQQEDQRYPDAAATLDDWVFQGFDTAFFQTLMRN
ncbi:hypothetical protein THARTR1_01962 [Trichoderma harzianum]|uniref:Transcription factor domain-containing protein n=1 Tax=Trichoderma harzianum TaxID=5544 RepID=A0A2K0UJ66_TRIHA|nr:hypothetical protein THARTR1_01962 [Trichoderma harzianum]